MKIPVVQADVNVSGERPGGRIPAWAFMPPAAVAADELAQTAVIGAHLLGQREARQRQRQQMESLAEANDKQAQIELAAKQYEIDLRRTVTDPDEYEKQVKEGFAKIRDEITKDVTKPYTQQILAKKLPAVYGNLLERSAAHADGLRKESAVATRDRTTANVYALQALTPWDDDKEQGRLFGMIAGAAEDAKGYVGAADTEKFLQEHRTRYLKGIAQQHLDADPVGFTRDSSRYAPLGATELQTLRDRAEVRIDKAIDRQRAREKQMEESYQKALKADQDVLVGDFDRRAQDAKSEVERNAVLKDLDARFEMRSLPQNDYTRIRANLTAPKETPSDPVALSRYGLDAESLHPKVTMDEIDRAHEKYRNGLPGGLNYADANKIKSQLRQTMKANIDEAKSDLVREHNQAEQELRAYLGIKPGMIERMTENINTNDPIARLYAQGLAQLRMRSALFGGQDRPLAVISEIGPQLQRSAGVSYALQAQTIQQTLLFPTRQALEQGYRSNQVSKAQYLWELRQFDLLDKILPTVAPGQSPTSQPKQPGQIRPRIGG